MNEYLRNNQSALRTCILYEFGEGKPVYESYQNMCKRIGDDVICYVDFEFWFMRFANGKFDLNYDRSLDPKTRTLSDMPIHILEKIVNELGLKYRFVIRKVSRNFEYIIDSWNWIPAFKRVIIDIGEYSANLYFNGIRVAYNNNYKKLKNDNCTVRYQKRETPIESENNGKLAIDDLQIVFKNPKIELEDLNVISLNKEFNGKFESMLKSLDRKIPVKKVQIDSKYPYSEMTILPYLKSGKLKEIVLNINSHPLCEKQLESDELTTKMDEIVELEQFKEAEMLTLITNITTNIFPIESLLQCRRFTINFKRTILQTTMMRSTKILLKSTVLEEAILKTEFERTQGNIFTFLKQLGPRAIEVPDRPNVRRLPISNSNQFFEIVVQELSVCIKRTS